MKKHIFLLMVFLLALIFTSCEDKEQIGLLRNVEIQIDGEKVDITDTNFFDEKILYIYHDNGDQYLNYQYYDRISLDNKKYNFVAALPLDSGMPSGNLNDIIIPLSLTANQKVVITDPVKVVLPDDEQVKLNMKTRTGTIVVVAQDTKSDRRYNYIDISSKIYRTGYMPGNQSYIDGEMEIVRSVNATGGGVNFRDEFYLYPTKDESSEVELYFDFYHRSATDTVLVKSQKLAHSLSVEAGRIDTLKVFLNDTDEYINQNFIVSSEYEDWTEHVVTPTIIPSGYTMLTSDDDLTKVLRDMLSDDEVEEIKLYLAAGTEFPNSLGRLTFTKSISLLAEESGDRKVTITTGNMSFSGPDVKYVHFEGINFISTDNNLIVDVADGSFDIENFSLINCTVNDMGRGLVRFTRGGSDYNIRNFTIDNCTFLPWATSGYAFIITQNTANFYHNFRMTNSTSYAAPSCNKTLFEGIGNVTTDINVYIENCTFASNNTAYSLFDIRSNGDVDLKVRKCLFTAGDGLNPSYGVRINSSRTTLLLEDNYCTAGWAPNRDNLNPEAIEVGDKLSLFNDYQNFDLTIKDKSSPVYLNRIGDPRWIK